MQPPEYFRAMSKHYPTLADIDEPLIKINQAVDWEEFRPRLESIWPPAAKKGAAPAGFPASNNLSLGDSSSKGCLPNSDRISFNSFDSSHSFALPPLTTMADTQVSPPSTSNQDYLGYGDRWQAAAGTTTAVADMLEKVFGVDKYSEINGQYSVSEGYCNFAIKIGKGIGYLVKIKAINIALTSRYLTQVVLVALMVSGCASNMIWDHPDADRNQFETDNLECKAYAIKETRGSEYDTGTGFGDGMAEYNEKRTFYKLCMHKKGYYEKE